MGLGPPGWSEHTPRVRSAPAAGAARSLSLQRTESADHGAFYGLFGRGIDPGAWDTYRDYLQPHLDDEARVFWEGRSPLGKRRFSLFANSGLYRRGLLGRFIGFLHFVARLTGNDPTRM